MSDSVRPQRWQPTRLPHPWDSPGKNTGVGCHFLQCMKVKSEREVAHSCSTLINPMDCCLPGSSIHGIFHARVLEWGVIAFSKVGIEGTYLNLIKAIYNKPMVNIILNDEKLKALNLEQDKEAHFCHIFQHNIGSPSHNIQTRQRKHI